MSVTRLQKWDVTAIEIALDLEMPHPYDPEHFVFSGPAEPRLCLVAGFALTSQLKRIVAAVDRAAPTRPPPKIRISAATARSATPSVAAAVSVQPMALLLRLQTKLIRAIEPGLARNGSLISVRLSRDMDDATAAFIKGFVPRKTLPSFEPPCAVADFDALELHTTGVTIYRLGDRGNPQSIIAHWPHPPKSSNAHLPGGH